MPVADDVGVGRIDPEVPGIDRVAAAGGEHHPDDDGHCCAQDEEYPAPLRSLARVQVEHGRDARRVAACRGDDGSPASTHDLIPTPMAPRRSTTSLPPMSDPPWQGQYTRRDLDNPRPSVRGSVVTIGTIVVGHTSVETSGVSGCRRSLRSSCCFAQGAIARPMTTNGVSSGTGSARSAAMARRSTRAGSAVET